MTRYSITIEADGAAFGETPLEACLEVGSILRRLADRLGNGEEVVALHDHNGNKVGEFRTEHDDEGPREDHHKEHLMKTPSTITVLNESKKDIQEAATRLADALRDGEDDELQDAADYFLDLVSGHLGLDSSGTPGYLTEPVLWTLHFAVVDESPIIQQYVKGTAGAEALVQAVGEVFSIASVTGGEDSDLIDVYMDGDSWMEWGETYGDNPRTKDRDRFHGQVTFEALAEEANEQGAALMEALVGAGIARLWPVNWSPTGGASYAVTTAKNWAMNPRDYIRYEGDLNAL